ncbi:hypothetical protein E2C01_028536 [Portunus trituberculatus]|uniref:Uncharacterized protein n=1 Tax=Portunus trituberculatus TaxID=210409 RepID=A0A5B7ELT2_PORTR|nr:hypothetical protein [Portunus trituberculatus]
MVSSDASSSLTSSKPAPPTSFITVSCHPHCKGCVVFMSTVASLYAPLPSHLRLLWCPYPVFLESATTTTTQDIVRVVALAVMATW